MTEIELTAGTADLSTRGALSENPAAVYLMSLAPGSRRTMINALGTMAGMLTGTEPEGREEQLGAALAYPWATLRYQDTHALRTRLADDYAAATVNKMLSALRRVLKECWRLHLMSNEDRARAADVENVKGKTLPAAAGRALSSGELDALLTACGNDPTPAGARDAALIAVAYSCGLRRAEVVAADLDHLDPETGALEIHGKRNKARMVHVVNGARAALNDWLHARGDEPGALFCPVDKGGNVEIRRLTPQAVYNAMNKRAGEAGVKDFSPHDMRRTFAGDLLDAGADIATVSKLMGHASVTTTARYDRRDEETKRKATELLHVPYRGRRLDLR